MLIARARFAGLPWEQVVSFGVIGGFILIAFTAQMIVAASTFTRALQDAHRANAELAQLNAELEQRVRERTSELQKANHRIQAANVRLEERAQQRAKDTSELVHDATGMLAVVSAGVSRLVYSVPDDVQSQIEQDAQDQLYPSIEIVHTMLASTLDAARLEAHIMTIDASKPVDLRAMVEKVGSVLSAFFQERQLAYTISVAPDVPAVRGDEILLLRVLLNLLINAAKFTAPYHGDDGAGHVSLDIAPHGHTVMLQITDNGPGVPQKALATLAQRFSRAVQGNSAPQGTGIGLHAVAGIIGLHGGTMTIDSPGEGQGFTVTIHLPQAATQSGIDPTSTLTVDPTLAH